MRVLAFTTVFPNAVQPQHGLFVLERLRHCARRAEIRVVAPRPFYPWPAMRGVPRREVRDGLPVEHPVFRYLPRFGKPLDGLFLYASALRCVRRLRREFDFDLIDAHFGYPDGYAAVLLGRLLRRPVVVTLRGTEPLVAAAGPGRRRALAWALRHADRLIAVSQPLAEDARALMAEYGPPEGCPPVTVIANGVDAARFAPRPQAEARAALGLPAAGRLLVSVGHLSPRKGFQRVLRVMPELLRAVPDLRFAIIGGRGGEGDNGPELRRLAAELDLAERVVFAGPQPPERVALWLNAADLFVLASDHEGCPNVVWEALACGLPVVATRVGEVPAMVPDFAGLLFDRAEDAPALRAALAEGLARRHDRAAIRRWAERHTWDGVADRVFEQWASALAPAAAPGWAPAKEGIAA
jgi:teichuronic acid biosynthesis glycosyltransferase TuaC